MEMRKKKSSKCLLDMASIIYAGLYGVQFSCLCENYIGLQVFMDKNNQCFPLVSIDSTTHTCLLKKPQLFSLTLFKNNDKNLRYDKNLNLQMI